MPSASSHTCRNILVTGGAGYLGSHVTDLLRDRCTVYDNLLYTNEYFRDVDFVYGDVTDYESLKTYLDQADCVIWLAAIVGDAACMVNPIKAIQTNQTAVEFLSQNYDGPIIFISTCSVYGALEENATETSPTNPLSLYAETKLEAEKYLADKRALVLRLGTLHGVSDRMRFDLVVNILTMRAILNKRIEVFGGNQYRPLLSVKDQAEFIVSLVDHEWEPGIYNVASENLSILEVADIVRAEIPDVRVDIVTSKFEDNRNYRVDAAKAETRLGFKGQRLVRDSVRDVSQLVRSGRIRDFSDLRYANLSTLQSLEV